MEEKKKMEMYLELVISDMVTSHWQWSREEALVYSSLQHAQIQASINP